MKLYHGTSLENANKIKEEGFKVVPSYEMAMGLGAYFTPQKESAENYVRDWNKRGEKGAIIKFNLPESVHICPIMNYEGIGTFYQNYESWCRDQIIEEIAEQQGVDYDEADYSDDEVEEKCFELYQEDAELFTEDIFQKDGCQAVCSESQCVIYDPAIIQLIRGNNIHIHGI